MSPARGDTHLTPHDQHLHSDSLPSPEADRGLRGPLEDVDGGDDGGHDPIDADISVSDKLSKTLVILDNSIIRRSPVKAGRQMGEDIKKSKYCPSWLQIDFRAEYVYTEIEVSDSDKANIVSSFK